MLTPASASRPFGARGSGAHFSPTCVHETIVTDSRKDKLHEFIDKTDPIIDQVDDYATTTFGWFKPVLYVAAAALVLKFILN